MFDQIGRVEVLRIDNDDGPAFFLRLHHVGGRFHVVGHGGESERRTIERLADDIRRIVGLPLS